MLIQKKISDWVRAQCRHPFGVIQALSGDASNRRYYRLSLPKQSFIVMYSPDKASFDAFFKIRSILYETGLSVPMSYSVDYAENIALLEDFGDVLYEKKLKSAADPGALYQQALSPLSLMQATFQPKDLAIDLPFYSALFLKERLNLFQTWYINRLLGKHWDGNQIEIWSAVNAHLEQGLLEQPLVFSHMDYHCRNLMWLGKNRLPGILDFQDAMWAPCTVDLVSLLKDCYIEWPRAKVVEWVGDFFNRQRRHTNLLSSVSFPLFLRWFDWMGVQRHLRILGTFAKLAIMDHKTHYLQYVPRIQRDIVETAQLYPELASIPRLFPCQVP